MAEKPQKERPHLYLIDGSGYIFRAYHAIRSSLSNSKGMPTNAVYGYTQMLRKVLKDQTPTHCAVAFDLGPPAKRLELYPAYKANRPETPEEIKIQWPYCRDMTQALGVAIVEDEGIEADDLIGTLARKAEAEGFDVTIITSDKDFYQLVGPHIRLWDTMKDRRIGIPEVEERFGVPPDHVVDVLGLMGDSVDNVPGVPGIGEKTAKSLMQEFGDVETLLGRLDELKPGKQRERLENNADLARLSVELVTIDTDMALDFGIDALKVAGAGSRKRGRAAEGAGVPEPGRGDPGRRAAGTDPGQELHHDPEREGYGRPHQAAREIGRLRHRPGDDEQGADVGRDRRLRALIQSGRGLLRARDARLRGRPEAVVSSIRPGQAGPAPHGSQAPQVRTEHQVRHDRAGPGRGQDGRGHVRHHAGGLRSQPRAPRIRHGRTLP